MIFLFSTKENEGKDRILDITFQQKNKILHGKKTKLKMKNIAGRKTFSPCNIFITMKLNAYFTRFFRLPSSYTTMYTPLSGSLFSRTPSEL